MKPCPFCGSEEVDYYCNYSFKVKAYFVKVECNVCGASTKGFIYKSDDPSKEWNYEDVGVLRAGEAWNRRADE